MNVDNNSGSKVSHVTDQNWEQEVIEASKTKPVFVDFWAEWCGPCKVFEPVVEKVAQDMSDKVKFTKLDTDANPNTTQSFGVMAIPTLMIFVNGEKVVQQSGVLPESVFRQMLDEQISRMNS